MRVKYEMDVEPITKGDRRDAGGVIHAFEWGEPRPARRFRVDLRIRRNDPGDAAKSKEKVEDDRDHRRSLTPTPKFCQY